MLDFPATPTTGQIYNGTNGVTYRWDGTLWLATGASTGGDFCANQTSSFPPGLTASFVTLVLTQVISGNTSGVYSTSTGRYTPPAGRYVIEAGFTQLVTVTPQNVLLQLRKNGVMLQQSVDSAPSSGYHCNPAVSVIVDCNGTDWFDIQASAGGGGGGTMVALYFQAFPISGIKGPPGDPHGYLGGDFSALQTSGFPSIGAAFTTLVPTPVITGNSSGWYSTSTGRFTPPAGRFTIYGSWSMTCGAVSFASLLLRKNGTTLMRSEEMVASANATCENIVSLVVDTNGTDWFDIQGASSAGSSTSYHMVFQAFPISGIKGPPGDATPGTLIQTVSFQTGALSSGATTLPADDTIPQITEGNEYMTCTITPRSATSKLVIDVLANVAFNVGNSNFTTALFQDSTANALAAAFTVTPPSASYSFQHKLTHTMVSGTTSATTFRVRIGSSAAGTTTFNGAAGTRLFGGVLASSIVIQEVAP